MVDTDTNDSNSEEQEKPSFYDEFFETINKYVLFTEAKKAYEEEGDQEGITRAAASLYQSPEAKKVLPVFLRSDFDKVILPTFYLDYENVTNNFKSGVNNLEEILKEVKNQSVEAMLLPLEPKEGNECYELHKEARKLNKLLGDYQDESASPDEKKKAKDEMSREAIEFYGKHSSGIELQALTLLIQGNDELKVIRTKESYISKRKELEESLDDDNKMHSYIKDILDGYDEKKTINYIFKLYIQDPKIQAKMKQAQ